MKYEVRLILDPHSSMNPWPPGSWSNTLKSRITTSSFISSWFILVSFIFLRKLHSNMTQKYILVFFFFAVYYNNITSLVCKKLNTSLMWPQREQQHTINEIIKNYWKKKTTPPQQVQNPVKLFLKKWLWIVWSFCPGPNYCGLKPPFLIKTKGKKDLFSFRLL